MNSKVRFPFAVVNDFEVIGYSMTLSLLQIGCIKDILTVYLVTALLMLLSVDKSVL